MAQTSILGRIGQLLRANVNSLLDSAEDPEKMLDQLIRDFTNNIAEAEDAVAQTIGKSIQPPADSDGPLDLALRGACVLAAAVARKDAADAALTVLPTSVRSRYTAPGGEPTAEFGKLYDTLLQTEPMA